MKKLKNIIFHLIVITLLSNCAKDKLNDEYNAFEGSYEWKHSSGQKGNVLAPTTVTLYQKEVGYKVTFELNNNGEALFYKDGNLISKNQYRINDKESNEFGGKQIIIKLKGDLHGMNIKDEILKLTLSHDTALSLTNFPFPAIDKIENYKSDYSGSSNTFRKK